ncbi:AAA family ATPase [Pseudomonas sp. SWRI196]|uniref:AAA family ATPase n=1 Tax=Pseudomonas tehranensis TaxID=2745502 RepID=A0ABR6UNG0_9PSED|nr:AAA family ATPase [Pseudomonas tehranensis]MBC3346104.1 AAA family ATPase [Pseudomonas tehranensis]
MQLHRIRIPAFRNLRGLEIAFDTHLQSAAGAPADAEPKPIRSHALIGQNGIGKSNLIEALITIFRDVDLDREAAFDYTLEYSIRGHTVRIEADTAKQKRPFVWVDGERVNQEYLNKNDPPDKEPLDRRRGPRLLPTHIFAYYSGRNERIEALFQEHQRRFNRLQEITTDEVLTERLLENFVGSEADIRAVDEAKRRRESRLKQAGDDRLRRLFYCRGGHSQLVLLACLLSDDPVFQKVLKNLHIESLESALFVLKEPHRLREKRRGGRFDEQELNEGDPRFWYARGNVVSEFLDKLWQVAWAPIEQEATKQIDFRGRTEKQKQLYLFVPSQGKLKQLGDWMGGTDSFFRYAEGAYIGDLIDEVRITVKKRDEHGGKVSFTQLSEGELQMLTVLGLMRITREDHCLFLLDEPDTHLNPIWKLRYFDDIEGVLSLENDSLVQGESQILITTHDPMMVGSLRKEQVHIIRKRDGNTLVEQPDEHPQGMGVSGLLKSEMFGLPSTLDRHTLNALQRRNDLLARRKHEGLSHDEQQELECLVVRLDDLGFSREYRDPMYQLFIEQMYKVRSKPLDELLTEDELQQQNALAEKVMEQLVKAQRMDDLSSLAQELSEKLKG